MSKVAVIGSGSWGTAIARLLGLKGIEVSMWSHGADTPAFINESYLFPSIRAFRQRSRFPAPAIFLNTVRSQT